MSIDLDVIKARHRAMPDRGGSEDIAALLDENDRLRAKAYGIRVGTTPLINTHDDLLDAVAFTPHTDTVVLVNVPVRLVRPLLAVTEAARALVDVPRMSLTPVEKRLESALDALDAGGGA